MADNDQIADKVNISFYQVFVSIEQSTTTVFYLFKVVKFTLRHAINWGHYIIPWYGESDSWKETPCRYLVSGLSKVF